MENLGPLSRQREHGCTLPVGPCRMLWLDPVRTRLEMILPGYIEHFGQYCEVVALSAMCTFLFTNAWWIDSLSNVECNRANVTLRCVLLMFSVPARREGTVSLLHSHLEPKTRPVPAHRRPTRRHAHIRFLSSPPLSMYFASHVHVTRTYPSTTRRASDSASMSTLQAPSRHSSPGFCFRWLSLTCASARKLPESLVQIRIADGDDDTRPVLRLKNSYLG